ANRAGAVDWSTAEIEEIWSTSSLPSVAPPPAGGGIIDRRSALKEHRSEKRDTDGRILLQSLIFARPARDFKSDFELFSSAGWGSDFESRSRMSRAFGQSPRNLSTAISKNHSARIESSTAKTRIRSRRS